MIFTEEMAEVIMGSFAVCYSEGQSGIVDGVRLSESEWKKYANAETDIVRYLYNNYTSIVSKYSWLPEVEKLIKEHNAKINSQREIEQKEGLVG